MLVRISNLLCRRRRRRHGIKCLLIEAAVAFSILGLWLLRDSLPEGPHTAVVQAWDMMQPDINMRGGEQLLHNPTPSVNKSDCYLRKYCIKYLISPTACNKNRTQFLLTFILSKMSDFGHRQYIRDTWANTTVFRDQDLRVVFVLGRMLNYVDYVDRLEEEARVYNDLILVDFVEHYDNLTLKTITGLHWAAQNCPNVVYVLKTDDDIIINMFILLSRLYQMRREKKTSGIIMGCLYADKPVYRDGKWVVPMEEYSKKTYPNYVDGNFYLMSAEVVQKLYAVALRETGDTFLRMEDALVTGFYGPKVNVTPIDMKKAKFYKLGKRPIIKKNNYKIWYYWHAMEFNTTEKIDTWNAIYRFSHTSTPYVVLDPDPYNYLLYCIDRRHQKICF